MHRKAGIRPGLFLFSFYGTVYGMAAMNTRATYAFDQETVDTIRALATRWGVSQSEAVRKAVRLAARQAAVGEDMPPYEALLKCFEAPLATKAEVKKRQAEARRLRKGWGEGRRSR